MDYARPIMWNVPHWAEITRLPADSRGRWSLFSPASVWRVRKWFARARPSRGREHRPAAPRGPSPRRLVALGRTVFFQARLSGDPFSLVMHLAIFWGMVVLADRHGPGHRRPGLYQSALRLPDSPRRFYALFKLALDVFGIVLIAGLVLAAYRRYCVRPKRLQAARAGVSLWDGFPLLAVLLLIAVTGFVIGGLRIAEGFQIDAQVAAASGPGEGPGARGNGPRERLHVGPQRQEAELRRIAAGGPVFPAATWAPVGYGLGKLLRRCRRESIRPAAPASSGGCTPCWPSG